MLQGAPWPDTAYKPLRGEQPNATRAAPLQLSQTRPGGTIQAVMPTMPRADATGGVFTLVAVCMTVAGLLAPSQVQACGGLFCSRAPVDQRAERIVFSMDPDGMVTARVQLRYTGDREGFAWVLPVPGVPVLATFPQEAFDALDAATRPTFSRPECFALTLAPASLDSGGSGVRVVARAQVGPYDTVTIEGTDADQIVRWLRDNGFRLTDGMIPKLAGYVSEGMKFLAMKLLPEAGVSDIEPIAVTYPGTHPVIPLQLTAVAAEPEMGIVVYVLADQRYAPRNYAEVSVDLSRLSFFDADASNYLTEVRRAVDGAGGLGFVTEYAQPTTTLLETLGAAPDTPEGQAADAELRSLLAQHRFITRMYTRISAHEMVQDPAFGAASQQDPVDNVHDLSDSAARCGDTDACAFLYCGPDSECVEADSVFDPAMCRCHADTVARMLTSDYGGFEVVCEPLVNDFGQTADPCHEYDCGEGGECVAMNGSPTCRCGELPARVARIDHQGGVGVVCDSFILPPPPREAPPWVGSGWSTEDLDGGTHDAGSRARSEGSDQRVMAGPRASPDGGHSCRLSRPGASRRAGTATIVLACLAWTVGVRRRRAR